ncbi:hypothetical protein DLS49_13590, partial [Staphylococcus pseudintermedius]
TSPPWYGAEGVGGGVRGVEGTGPEPFLKAGGWGEGGKRSGLWSGTGGVRSPSTAYIVYF